MTKAVQFDSYGGVDVLEVRDVPRPVPGAGEVLVEVRAAGINISEAAIRAGAVRDHVSCDVSVRSGQRPGGGGGRTRFRRQRFRCGR